MNIYVTKCFLLQSLSRSVGRNHCTPMFIYSVISPCLTLCPPPPQHAKDLSPTNKTTICHCILHYIILCYHIITTPQFKTWIHLCTVRTYPKRQPINQLITHQVCITPYQLCSGCGINTIPQTIHGCTNNKEQLSTVDHYITKYKLPCSPVATVHHPTLKNLHIVSLFVKHVISISLYTSAFAEHPLNCDVIMVILSLNADR